jgi:EmrB/QacA subfamily drug resistance transporter
VSGGRAGATTARPGEAGGVPPGDGHRPSSSRPAADRGRRLLVFALVLGSFVGMVDATIVAVALQPLTRHFHVSLAAGQAVLGVYLVTITATLPLLGRLADRYGRRRAYVAGFVVFALGSVGAALAPGFEWLMVARAVQACGGGMLTAGGLALMAQHAPQESTGRSIALLVITQAVAGLVGPPLGGALTALWGWQAVFWASAVAAAAGLVTVWRAVPASGRVRDADGVDIGGAIGVAALLLGIGTGIGSLGAGGTLRSTLVWFGVAAVGATVLLAVEPRARFPLLDRRLLRPGRFASASLASFLSTGTLMSCFALLPFWLEDAHHASAALAGAAFLPIGVGIGLTSRTGGRLGDKGHTREVTVAGMTLAASGLVLASLGARTDVWPILLLGLLVLGMGNGLFSSPNTAAAIVVAPRSALGSASGFLSTARNAGVVFGLGITGAVYSAIAHNAPVSSADRAAEILFGAAAVVCFGVAGLAARTYRDVDTAVAHSHLAPEELA